MTEPTEVSFDHHSPEFAANWEHTWRDLQQRCPVAHTDSHGGYWIVTKYDDVAEISHDDESFGSFNDVEGDGARGNGIMIPRGAMRFGMIEHDPPESTELRTLTASWFAPATVEKLRPWAEEFTRQAIDDVIESGSCDLVLDVAGLVPAAATLRLMGLPTEEHAAYSEAFHKNLYVPTTSPEYAEVAEMLNWCMEQVATEVAKRREEPKDDLITALVQAEINGEPLSDPEILGVMLTFLGGGLETTTGLTANALSWLDEHPEERERLRDPKALRIATEEFLRHTAPIGALGRTVRDNPYTLRGCTFQPGDSVLVSWQAANRDPDHFERPDEMVLDRWPNKHTSFGLGGHRCLGSALARMEFQVMVSAVLERIPDYRVVRERAVRNPSIGTANGFVSLPVEFTPGRRSTD